ncbi:hypothetical protein BD779DRAFT_1485744 [Infundibulicybe gibba]|nr:hypothetical protein BD779DRAFT_1485744 [Infundibulicybe gibba]
MSEDARSKARKFYYVTNPSEDSDGDDYTPHQSGTAYADAQPSYVYPSPPSFNTRPQNHYHPTPLNTNLHSIQARHPSLSSPSSTSSPAAEESTPPPTTPSLPAPPPDIPADIQDPANDRATDATSPTASTPDSYTSTSSHASGPSVVERILVTDDSDRFVIVEITGAKNAAFIRECIFSKLNIYDEEAQAQFAIYQTEIGAFAIGESLSDEKLFELCRSHGDSRGSLKFFVSHKSAAVHEQPLPHSPTVNTIPPPVLPQHNPGGYAPLRPKRRSKSRRGSLSSASEQLPLEVGTGYEADLDNPDRDRDGHRTTLRPSPQQQILPSIAGPSNPAPLNPRRPSGPPRPSSPLVRSSQSTTPPPPPPSLPPAPLIDRYGKVVPIPPPPPPLSPNRPTFAIPTDSALAPPTSRITHARSGSDAAAEREQILVASEQQFENAGRQWQVPSPQQTRRLRPELSRENLARLKGIRPGTNGRRQQKELDEKWVVVPNPNPRENEQDQQDTVRPLVSRPARPPQPISPSRYKPTSPYTGRPIPIPSAPLHPPPAAPVSVSESRTPTSRQAGVPVPLNVFVTYKGEMKGDQKGRLAKGARSMDNLKAAALSNHPVNLQPGRRGQPQMPTSRPSINGLRDHITFSSGSTSAGLPKSYEPPRHMKPLPISSHSSSLDFGQSSHIPFGSRGTLHSAGLVSPNQDPFPRPHSALGDSLTSPSKPSRQQITTSPRRSSPPLSTFPSYDPLERSDRPSETLGPTTSRTSPPTSPVSSTSSSHGAPDKHLDHPSLGTTNRSSSSTNNTNRSSEATVTQEDRNHLARWAGNGSDGTLVLPRPQDTNKVSRPRSPPPPPSSSSEMSPVTPYGVYDESDSEEDEGTSMWNIPPMADLKRPKSILRGPALTVQIENPSGVQEIGVPGSDTINQSSHRHPTFSTPPIPSRRPSTIWKPTLTHRTKASARSSTFADTRPPPEDVYERLEDFFPEHDLDKPVIEASSGGTSPTTVEQAAVPVPPAPISENKSRGKNKKSIRLVAQEHKKLIDRTSRAAESSDYASLMRKRSTKLWGSKLEEVTTMQAKANINPTLPESPSGGPTTFKWVRGELIGKGTYGRVYLALNATTGEMIAVKQVEIPRTASDKNDSRQVTVVQALKLESETLKDLDHPNIVQYLGFEETPTNLSIFLEYVPGGSVGSCLLQHGKFNEEVTKSFTSQILAGLEYLHSRGILHRDLKADNILVEMSGICKISDFGISKRTDDQSGGAHTAMQGTVFWMAPEVINTKKKGYNFKIDIWSVGCVVLEMWAGMRPWMGDEAVAVMFKLYQSKLPPPVPEDVVLTDLADDFRRRCFAINPEERPTAAELREHPYLILSPDWVFTSFN